MTQNHIATVNPLPSSILHNSAEVRRQYTTVFQSQDAELQPESSKRCSGHEPDAGRPLKRQPNLA